MCNLTHDHSGEFGFIVDLPEIRLDRRGAACRRDDRDQCRPRRRAQTRVCLAARRRWLASRGICSAGRQQRYGWGNRPAQALYRAEDGSLCLFSLVVPQGRVDTCARSPCVGFGRRLPRRTARHNLRASRRWRRPRAERRFEWLSSRRLHLASSIRCSRRTAIFTT